MNEPVYMLNALWFKKDGGKQKYREYSRAVAPLLEKAGASINDMYRPEKSIIGEWNPDAFFVVKYPSKEAFNGMANSPEYAEIRHLREDALENSLLIRCREFEL